MIAARDEDGLARLVDLHDGSPSDDDESDKQNRFNDHAFDPSALRHIEDRPATVVNKIWVLS